MSHTIRHIVRGMRSREAQPASGPTARGADLRTMRELNHQLVLDCVREQGPIARVEIARHTHLSRTTVSALIDILLREGLVEEGKTQSAAPHGGRRAILVHFNATAGVVVGVDMGRSHLTMLLTDLAARVVARSSGPFDVDQGPAVGLPWVIREVRRFLAEQGVAWDRVIGVGMGMPGPMDARLHRPIAPPRMPGWDGVDVRSALRRELGVPVFLDNDANLGALGESRFGAGAGVADLVYVKIGTGIGGGLVMGGVLYRGSAGSAGEIGHVSVREDGPLCDCGSRGCLEAMAGARVIVEDARRAADRASPLATRADLDVADVVRAAQAGDCAAAAAIQRAGEHIGVVLAGLMNVVNPSLILLDGAVARAGDILLDPIRRTVAARSFSVASAHTQVRVGSLGADAIALGGVALVIDAAFRTSERVTMGARPAGARPWP
ncbi:MAG TPA: ROK family transcriptional regulator, partial [Ktedonobacterales bacterium]